MDSIAIQTLLIGIVVGVSCSILGVFLILRKMSMIVDAISHTVLLGIVLAYWITKDLNSPLLMVGATLMGVITVILIELLVSTKRTSEDAATGVVFPFLFSVAVILISTRFSHTHLDSHAISGNLEFAAFDQWVIHGVNVGSKTLFINSIVLVLIVGIISLLYKEFKIATFDQALAKSLGMMPLGIHYLLTTMVSLTAVTSFNAVGSILVIAMMIGPAATALLITKQLHITLFAAAGFAVFNASVGYWIAMFVFMGNVNLATTIVVVTFITFLSVWILNPKHGLITNVIKKMKQKSEFELFALLIHVVQHESIDKESQVLHINLIQDALNWSETRYLKILKKGIDGGYLTITNKFLKMTPTGRSYYDLKIKSWSSTV